MRHKYNERTYHLEAIFSRQPLDGMNYVNLRKTDVPNKYWLEIRNKKNHSISNLYAGKCPLIFFLIVSKLGTRAIKIYLSYIDR